MVKGQDEGVGVERLGADLGGILDFAGIEGFAVFEDVEHVGVLRAESGHQDATESIDEVVRGYGVAVGPASV